MADNFQSSRRDPLARAAAASPRETLADPLAELARLIGQSAPRSGYSGDAAHETARYDDAPAAAELEWAAGGDTYVGPAHEAHESYSPHSSDDAAWPQDGDDRDQGYDDRLPARLYAGDPGPASDDGPDRGQRQPPASGAQALRYAPPPHDGYPADDRRHYAAQAQGPHDDAVHGEHDDTPSPRRSGTILILAVLGLAVLGTAGALGYRAMFGGSMVSGLPPIIKPADGPIKVQPSQGSQAGNAGKSETANAGAAERLVEHQEQPIDVQSANPPVPRVVTTIPVISNAPAEPLPAAGQPAAAGPPAAARPVASPPADSIQSLAAANPPAAPAPQPAQATGPVASGAKQIHTLIIRPGQPTSTNPAPAAAAPPAAHVARPHQPLRPRQTTTAGGPLSIVPGPDGEAQARPPARTHVAMREPGPAETAPAGGSGEFAVQVSSQRSEAEAQAAFRALQAKYPEELGGRRPIVRRADLGAKGVYYRALVGPFASGEQAVQLCSKLKAAGGSCIIQRN